MDDFPKQNRHVDLAIEGMSCITCAKTIEKALLRVDGVKQASVNFALSKASIDFDPGKTNTDKLIETVSGSGYSAILKDGTDASQIKEIRELEHKSHLVAFIISLLLTLPFILQMVGSLFGNIGEIPVWMQAILATIVQFWCGFRFYKGSYHALRVGSANMDVLIAMGTTAAYLFSICVVLFHLKQPVYFETSTIIITLILLGRWLESRTREHASLAVHKLMQLQPKMAIVEREGHEIALPIDQLVPGDIFVIKPGDSVPVDGIVTEGKSSIKEALLTGESSPVPKENGSKVFAGTINQLGSLKARATEVGSETFLASIIRLVEHAQGSKAPIQRLADIIAGIFVPIVLLVGLLTFVGWFFAGAPVSTALINLVAVLIIACPCALGLATPTVIMTASGIAADNGIIFREASAIEETEKIQVMIFDKTGTLTEGEPTVTTIIPSGPPHTEEDILNIAASIEHNSEHPLAQAIVQAAQKRGIPIEPTTDFKATPGRGVQANKRGKTYYVGSTAYALEKNIKFSEIQTSSLRKRGNSIIAVWSDKEPFGFLAIEDPLRKNAAQTIRYFNDKRIRTLMLTGDHKETAAIIAGDAGIQEYYADLSPQDKVREITKIKDSHKIVGMMGDGINDAPALATAHVGFSISTGSDIAMEAADVTLMGKDLMNTANAFDLSQAAMRKIRSNLFFAFFYNCVGIPLAAFGFLNPIVAAAAMALSSLSVVFNALLLKRWKPQN